MVRRRNARVRAMAVGRRLLHECERRDEVVVVSELWRFCPFCGAGLVHAIQEAKAERGLAEWRELMA